MKKLLTLALALAVLAVLTGPAVAQQQSWSVAIEQNPMLTNCGATTNIPVAGAGTPGSCATAIPAAQNLLTTLLATPNCMVPHCPAGYTMTPGVPSCTPDPYTLPNGQQRTRYQVNLKWNCVPPHVSCATPPPATNYNTGSTSANNVPLNQCYKNTVGECLYNFAAPGTAGGWNTGCPLAIAGSNCCGWTTPPATSCTQELNSGVLTIGVPTVSNITATSSNLSGTVSVTPIPPGCTYTAKLVWGQAPTPPFPNLAGPNASGSIPPSPLNLSGTATPLQPSTGYGARIEVTKQCGGLAPTTCFGPTKRFETPKAVCTITITKKTGPVASPPFPFTVTGPPTSSFTLTNGQSHTVTVPCASPSNPSVAASYTVTETSVPGWAPTNITCGLAPGGGSMSLPTYTGNSAQFQVGLTGSIVQCTFTNTPCKDVTMNLSTGQSPWTVSPGAVGVITNLGPLSGVWVPPGPASWIQPASSTTPQLLPGGIFYQYSVPFTLNNPTLYSTIQVTGRYAADNGVPAGVSMNSGPPVAPCAGSSCFSSWHPFTITQTSAIPSSNHLDIRVYNNPTGQGGHTYTGLVVDATLQAICKK